MPFILISRWYRPVVMGISYVYLLLFLIDICYALKYINPCWYRNFFVDISYLSYFIFLKLEVTICDLQFDIGLFK